MSDEQKWLWINVGKFADFVVGKREIIIYANTEDMVWHIGVIING